MTLDEITRDGLNPAFALLPSNMDTLAARVMLLVIALQESRLQDRRQLVGSPPKPTGPAKSFWQAEQGGGMVKGVRTHQASKQYAETLYISRGVESNDRAIWDAIENDDVLAAGLARLLLFTDPGKLPTPNDEEAAFQMYLRVWRPGAWTRGTEVDRSALRRKWATNHDKARTFVGNGS